MDSLIFELQIAFYLQLFLSANVRHSRTALTSSKSKQSAETFVDASKHFQFSSS